MAYTFPTELDDSQRLLAIVGSFWADTYQGNQLVESALHARAQLSAQAHANFLDLLASVSRFKVPVFHRQNWTAITLRESDLRQDNLAKFDGEFTFSSGLSFDVPPNTPFFVWALTDPPEDVRIICDSIIRQTVAYVAGLDFFLRDGQLWLRANPFDNPLVIPTEVFTDDVVTDRECILWLYRGDWDWDSIFEQFGYAIDVRLKSSVRYRELVNAIYDGFTEGTGGRCVEEAMQAICDVPLAAGTETVEHIIKDRRHLWVITDTGAYRYGLNATPIVAVGDQVSAGQPLVDALQFFELNRGQRSEMLRALAISSNGLLATGYHHDLVFENKLVPLVVDSSGEYTRISFEIGGMPFDVEKFWDDVHAAGVAAGQTLAMLMAGKPADPQYAQVGALSLPATINPLQFLTTNVLRNNLYVILVKPTGFGPDALGLTNARHLRKLIPPHTAAIILAELAVPADQVIMDGPGSETAPGYEERVTSFQGSAIAEAIGPDMVRERVKIVVIGGQCH